MTTNATTLIDRHLEAYGEPDRVRRDELIRQVWAADGRLIDPPLDGAGHQGISELAEAVQTQFAGHAFRRTTEIDAHHDRLRYGWELVGPGGEVAVAGVDVAELTGDGRLAVVTGFFGDLQPRG